MENIRRMENRPATLFTTHGDTIYLNKLRFKPDMLKPEILIQEKIINLNSYHYLKLKK